MAEAKIKITADTSQATREIDRLDDSLKNLKSVSADAAKALAVITGAALAMGYAIKSTLDAAGALVDASNRLGVSASNLNTLQQAARLAGLDADTLNMSIQRLNKSIGEGLQKNTAASAVALQQLGLPIQEISKLKPDQQFEKIAESLAAIENPAQRTALSMELFGKQGPAILQVANELAKVKKLTAETGFLVSERDLIALDEAGDAVSELGILWDAGVKKAVAELAPYIVGFVIQIKQAIIAAGGFEGIWNRIKEIVHTVANVIAIMAAIMVTRMVVATAQVAIQMGRAALAAKSFSLFLSRTPIGLLSAGAAILADKIGIDLVGGLGSANGLQDTYKLGQDAINAAMDESNKKLNETGEAIKGINEEQKKLQTSFTDAVKASELDLKYQEDILAVGKEQADINKIINDHKQKHKEAGIAINVEEEKKLRANMAQSQSLQKQNELLTQQKQLIEGYINAQRPGEKLVQDIENLRRTLAGEPIIVPIKIETQDDMAANANKALEQAKKQAGEFADGAIAQYSKLYGEAFQITNDYNKAVRELDDALLAARAAGGEQELARVQAIEEAKLAVQENAQRRRMEMEISRFENATKLNDLQIDLDATRHAESLRNQKDIFGNAMFNQKQLMEIARDRADFEKKTELEKTQFGIQQAATLFGALGAHNKKAFEAAKAFNIANAIMNTYTAATKALATYPFPFGLIAAAAAVAAGLAQVAQIRSQQYSGRALGGPVMGGKSYVVGESGPELFTPSTTGSITRNSDIGGGTPVVVNFNITANDTTGFDQLLASRKGMITQIINDAVLEKGRRSIA